MLHTPKRSRPPPSTAVLHHVEKPARYTGNELNSIAKDWADPAIRTKVALAFPDIYELGGSNLGLMVLYDLINRRADLLAERVIVPGLTLKRACAATASPSMAWKRATR